MGILPEETAYFQQMVTEVYSYTFNSQNAMLNPIRVVKGSIVPLRHRLVRAERKR